MGGVVGLLFREFAATVAVSILVSVLVSLTLTPMLCAKLLPAAAQGEGAGFPARSKRSSTGPWRSMTAA